MRVTLCKLFLIPAIAIAALAAPSAKAENVNVPFGFTADGHSFLAGTYSVEQSPSKNSVTLHWVNGLASFTWLMAPGDPAPSDTRVVLRFVETDGGHVLDSIQYRAQVTRHLAKHNAKMGEASVGGIQ